MNVNDLYEFYKSPSSSPLRIYSFKDIDNTLVDESGQYAYAYRIFIYKYDDYDPSKRPNNSTNSSPAIDHLDTPNSKSGTYVKGFTGLYDSGYVNLLEGIYTIEYVVNTTRYTNNMDIFSSQTIAFVYRAMAITYNRLPLKKWTITDVIDRIFDVIIPLRKGELPKFVLDDSLRTKYDNIIAPEFAFTKMTLREMLKQVGGFVHAEPRITGKNASGQWVVTFDEYGSNQTSWISNRRYVSATFGTDINDYCTSLDSSADNLVNQLNWAQGVVTEPFNGTQGKSLRTETTTTRMSEDNSTFISTDLPIYTIGEQKQVFCTHIPELGDGLWDITPYIFEKADYDNLSSYDGVYPFSKAYALYYTQGAKHIKGLFFKVPNAITPALEQYAIKNILEAVTGRSLSITGQEYMQLAFKVTYLPIFSARVRTNKQYIVGNTPRTLAYNQSANFIESQYYGENLKGVVARLGNVEKTYTYHLAHLCDIPKVGLLYDEYYYISAVSCEILPTYIKCTIALSKDFNRLSTYVGISSNKRMWEVSEKQAFERESIITEYVKITQNSNETNDNNSSFKGNIAKTLFNQEGITAPVSSAMIVTYPKGDGSNGIISLPAVSTAMGNSMLFSFRFEDNYSAGQQSVYKDDIWNGNGDNVNGYWGNYVSYCDYYGRFYWLTANFYANDVFYNSLVSNNTDAFKLPQDAIQSSKIPIAINNWKYRKDSREIPSITYELTAVTDIEDLIIGSALMKNCALVNSDPSTYQLYGFRRRLNAIDSKNITDGTLISNGLTINADSISVSGVGSYTSWAIVTASKPKQLTVEDEDGDLTTQTIELGKELVLGRNSSTGGTYYFSVKKDVYS